ncbi:DUF1493 family protein [Chryseobacterium fistulae]|uniref:DUF1493 family protein n=1 Tax=Chryseobacterium fistulae TaxID=2675058 RepID=A0A6N4XUJ7_9FLAO|nr:DUF1493 family protein [Chryseobacterium fistulae]CAA7386970.1 hypothetical protein CHRY9393_01271 [Chryseobacterium fistulae]
MDNVEEKVLQFFKKHVYKNIDINTVINYVFPTEDDIYNELVLFFEEYNIDPKDFNILKYFHPDPESMPLLKYYYGLIKGRFKAKNLPPLTIRHMIEVAKRKEWFDPE